MNQLTSILQDQFLDKEVEVQIPERDNFGRQTNKMIVLQGKCVWIGENELLEIPLQLTLNRMPITVKHITYIKLKL